MPIINGYDLSNDELNRVKETTTKPQEVNPATTLLGGVESSTGNLLHLLADPENISDYDYIPSKGFWGSAGELLNPINLVVGGGLGEVAGATLGTIGDLLPDALSSYSLKEAVSGGGQALKSTLANKALMAVPIVSKGAIEGAGWTGLDKAEQEAGNVDPSFSGQDLLQGALFGAAVEGAAPLVKSLFLQGIKNDDAVLGSTVSVRDKQYNPQDKMGYTVDTELGPNPEVKVTTPEISDSLLNKVGIERDSDVYKDQLGILSHVQGLIDSGVTSDDIPGIVQGIVNHTEAKYSKMVDDMTAKDPTIKRHLYNNSYGDDIDMGIKRALDGDLDNATVYDKSAADVYNAVDKSLVDTFNENGGDMGYIPGYRRQVHDVDRMLADNNYSNPANKVEEWAEFTQSLLKNDIDISDLKNSFQKIVKARDDGFGAGLGTNSKERVFIFKNADAENTYANKFGYKKSIALHLISNVKNMSRAIALQKIFREHNPANVIDYLGKHEGKLATQIKNNIEQISTSRLEPDIPLLSTATKAVLTASRSANAIASPAFTLIKNLPLDIATTFTHAWLRSDLMSAVKSFVTKSKPLGDLATMSKLPFEDRENLKNFFNDLNSEAKINMLDGFGVNTKDKYTKGLVLANRMAIKYSGAHILDNIIRKQADKTSTFIIGEQFKKDGLASLLPRANKDILADSVNEAGQLDPFKLEQKATQFGKDAVNTENIAQKKLLLAKRDAYQNIANRLQGLYSNWRNGINPLYSSNFQKLRRLDPAISAGARGALWHLTTLKTTFDLAKTKYVQAPNKFMAGASIAAAIIAYSSAEHVINNLVNSLEGKKEHENQFVDFAYKLSGVPKDNELLNITGNTIGNLLFFSSLYNNPIWYGAGAQATRAARYELSGDDDKAKQDLIKASPYAMIYTNLMAN